MPQMRQWLPRTGIGEAIVDCASPFMAEGPGHKRLAVAPGWAAAVIPTLGRDPEAYLTSAWNDPSAHFKG